jgi:hypothetical protein
MLFAFEMADPCTVFTVCVLLYGWLMWKICSNKTVQKGAKTGFWWWLNS